MNDRWVERLASLGTCMQRHWKERSCLHSLLCLDRHNYIVSHRKGTHSTNPLVGSAPVKKSKPSKNDVPEYFLTREYPEHGPVEAAMRIENDAMKAE